MVFTRALFVFGGSSGDVDTSQRYEFPLRCKWGRDMFSVSAARRVIDLMDVPRGIESVVLDVTIRFLEIFTHFL